jgi:hypothetical protein
LIVSTTCNDDDDDDAEDDDVEEVSSLCGWLPVFIGMTIVWYNFSVYNNSIDIILILLTTETTTSTSNL